MDSRSNYQRVRDAGRRGSAGWSVLVVTALAFLSLVVTTTAEPAAKVAAVPARNAAELGASIAADRRHRVSLKTNPCPSSVFKTPGPIEREVPALAESIAEGTAHAPARSPKYFERVYQEVLRLPLPDRIYTDGGIPATVPEHEIDPDSAGCTASYQPGGAVKTQHNAFFASLGTNGRACVTCHLPPSGMSVSLKNIKDRRKAPHGEHDPIFAPIDGSDCPALVPAPHTSGSMVGGRRGHGSDFDKAHHLILTRGLFRIFLPVPDDADYTISVVSDPYGCNATPGTTIAPGGLVSIYRRPLISGNLPFVTTTEADTLAPVPAPPPPPGTPLKVNSPFGLISTTQGGQTVQAAADPVYGTPVCSTGNGPVCVDPITGQPISGSIMWDGREPDLERQAIDATLGHAQAKNPPTAAEVSEIVAFENGMFNAQLWHHKAPDKIDLADGDGLGGPMFLYGYTPFAGVPAPTVMSLDPSSQFPPSAAFTPSLYLYSPWLGNTDAFKLSIYRGQQIFNGMPLPDGSSRLLNVDHVAGLTNIPLAPGVTLGPVQGGCNLCHNQYGAGSDTIPAAKHDLGIGGDSAAFGGPVPNASPYANDLPVFQITCKSGSTPFHGSTVTTTDPGLALISGKCADVGRFTAPPLRALAAHPPYFSDGSAATLMDVVNFYTNRFSIYLSAQDKDDLVNFLNSL